MKILIVGVPPYGQGGVPNYTRPLAYSFVEMGHKVYFFSSGAWYRKYNWILRPHLRRNKGEFPFEYVEVINSQGLDSNYGHPLLDMHAPQTEKLFEAYIKKIKPDVIHFNNFSGLPASLVNIASSFGSNVVNTVHAYGFLCQKQVMIDYRGNNCEGPTDLKKCAICTGTINVRKFKFVARMENTSKKLLQFGVKIKKMIMEEKVRDASFVPYEESIQIGEIAEKLRERLNYTVFLMNTHINLNICVSTDVKNTFKRYGVRDEKLIVNHIGSSIAELQQRSDSKLHNPIVIGNIGGVHYYKGTHIIIDAVSKIKKGNYIVKIFGKYEPAYVREMIKGREHLPIQFMGKYVLEDLPDILGQIDIMVLPSICNDTAPQTIFESYSKRIPIIASDIGGFPDFIKDRENGLLSRAGDSEDLAEKIQTLLDNPELIGELSKKIPRLKTITDNALELISLYERSARLN